MTGRKKLFREMWFVVDVVSSGLAEASRKPVGYPKMLPLKSDQSHTHLKQSHTENTMMQQ